MTTRELDDVKNAAFQRGVARGRFEAASDQTKADARIAANCETWKDGQCEVCGVAWQGFMVDAGYDCGDKFRRRP